MWQAARSQHAYPGTQCKNFSEINGCVRCKVLWHTFLRKKGVCGFLFTRGFCTFWCGFFISCYKNTRKTAKWAQKDGKHYIKIKLKVLDPHQLCSADEPLTRGPRWLQTGAHIFARLLHRSCDISRC